MHPITRYFRTQKRAFQYDERSAPSVLGPQKRTWMNECELPRMRSCYPLRFEQERAFKQAVVSG